MRFQTDEDAFRVLHDLARDVATRAEHAHCQAQDRITLRVLVRRPGAATPRKTLGHGVVDVTNRSCPLPRREAGSLEISMKTNQAAARSTTKLATKSTKSTKTTTSTTATRDPEVLFAAAKEGFLALGLSVGEVRGVGIVLPRLVHDDDLDSGVEDEGEGEDEECRDLAPGGRRVGRRGGRIPIPIVEGGGAGRSMGGREVGTPWAGAARGEMSPMRAWIAAGQKRKRSDGGGGGGDIMTTTTTTTTTTKARATTSGSTVRRRLPAVTLPQREDLDLKVLAELPSDVRHDVERHYGLGPTTPNPNLSS